MVGVFFNVSKKYVDFILAMINNVAHRDIFSVYNQLGDKMYKYRNKTATNIHKLRTQQAKCVSRTEYLDNVGNLQSQCKELEDENEQLEAEITVVKADMDVLNHNNSLLVNAVKELKAQMNTILTHLATLIRKTLLSQLALSELWPSN